MVKEDVVSYKSCETTLTSLGEHAEPAKKSLVRMSKSVVHG